MTERRRQLADVLAELASTAAEPFDIAELMHLAADRACEVLRCDAAVVLLSLDGRSLGAAGVSTGIPFRDELFGGRMATPCHDALSSGQPATFTDDDVPERYREFATMAEEMGLRGALAVPLCHRDDVIGTLCLMRTGRRHFLTHTIEDAQRLADVVAASVVREHAHRAALAVTAQLEHALQARIVVEQAKGMVAADLDLSVDDALMLLRRHARTGQRRLADVAGEVVSRQLSPKALR